MQDVQYLQKLREKRAQLVRTPAAFYNGMLICFKVGDDITLGFTVDPLPGAESLNVQQLKYEPALNKAIPTPDVSATSRAVSSSASSQRRDRISLYKRKITALVLHNRCQQK